MQFATCFAEKSPFQPVEQFSKLSLGGATIGARMAEKIENLRKCVQSFVRTTSTIYKRDERKVLPYSLLPHVL